MTDRTHDQGTPLLIVGSSTRAAAQSIIRGGWVPVCVDAYADYDLRQVAKVIPVDNFPAGVPDATRNLPQYPWMYTGGLENHPDIIATLMARQQLFGNGPDVLARIRDPWWLAERLRGAKLPALDVVLPDDVPPDPSGRWLRKPLAGAGGRAICLWNQAASSSSLPDEPYYFQRRAAGHAYSAQFVALPAQTLLLGVTRQLIGLRGVHAAPFAWCGAVTPVVLGDEVVEAMSRIGRVLAAEAKLCGVFGCDFIIDGQTPWLTEVNPRYTAAMELVECRLQTSLVRHHVEACLAFDPNLVFDSKSQISDLEFDISDTDPGASRPPLTQSAAAGTGPICTSPDRVLGKIVLFADRDLVAADATALLQGRCNDGMPFVADLPHPGQSIAAGQPVCTLFTYERAEEACIARLLQCAKGFRRRYLTEG
ncbi:MAG: ATP-grasp domain-containing protein [Planctomycetaceae bacterium]|nr:ATP-grasp domain-containing protein [Planctomycetaceae bacterium]